MPNVVSPPTTRGGPNVQAPIGNMVAQRMGASWAGSGPFALLNPLYRKRFGEISGSVPKNVGPGPLGELGIPGEGWAQNKQNKDTSFNELQKLVDTRNSVNAGLGLVNQRLGFGSGAGYGVPGGTLRKLLLQSGGVY